MSFQDLCIAEMETWDENSDWSDPDSSPSAFAGEPLTKRHRCTYPNCSKAFYRPSKLADHLRRHTEERPFKCDATNCEKAYHKKDALKRHQQQFHLKNIENAMCPIEGCMLVMRKQSLKKHLLRKHNTFRKFKFHCPECNKGFRNESELKNHSTEHSTPYKCHICGKEFKMGHRFRWHLKCHKNYKCICEMEFYDFNEYRTHKKYCPSSLKPSCEICNKVFASKFNLKQHCKHVHQEKDIKEKFKCIYVGCNKEFMYLKNLNWHINYFHIPKKDENEIVLWTCSFCQKHFKSKAYVVRHLKNYHLNPVPKIPKTRRLRFDKGLPKVPMSTKLTGIELNNADNNRILELDEKVMPGEIEHGKEGS